MDGPAPGTQEKRAEIALPRAKGDGGSTMDLQRHWTSYLCYAVAHDLALGNGMDVQFCGYLRSERDRLRSRSFAANGPRQPVTMHMTTRRVWR